MVNFPFQFVILGGFAMVICKSAGKDSCIPRKQPPQKGDCFVVYHGHRSDCGLHGAIEPPSACRSTPSRLPSQSRGHQFFGRLQGATPQAQSRSSSWCLPSRINQYCMQFLQISFSRQHRVFAPIRGIVFQNCISISSSKFLRGSFHEVHRKVCRRHRQNPSAGRSDSRG